MNLTLCFYGFLCISLGIFLAVLVINLLKKIKNNSGTKKSFYKNEQIFTFCVREDFNVHFYTLGLLFLLLISLSLFLLLWAVSIEGSTVLSFLPMIFIWGIFFLGYLYAWKEGLFE